MYYLSRFFCPNVNYLPCCLYNLNYECNFLSVTYRTNTFVFFAIYTGLLTAINCNNVKWATRVQDIFTGTKILALVIIVIAGMWVLASGKTENFHNPMANTNPEPGFIALAFYSGLFSYSGWWVCFKFLNKSKICLSIIPSKNWALLSCFWSEILLNVVFFNKIILLVKNHTVMG